MKILKKLKIYIVNKLNSTQFLHDVNKFKEIEKKIYIERFISSKHSFLIRLIQFINKNRVLEKVPLVNLYYSISTIT